MSLVIGSPALRLLARRKLRGQWRRQVRRMRTPKGAILAVMGALLFGGWILVVHFSPSRIGAGTREPEELAAMIRIGGLCMVLLTLGSSLTHRGLFLPKEEIERLFSAPLCRADTIRYRLWVHAGRSLLAGMLLGVVLSGIMPNPTFAFLGICLAMQSLPILSQATAILAGGLERKSVARLKAWPVGLVRLVCTMFAVVIFVVLAFGRGERSSGVLDSLSLLLAPDALGGLIKHPLINAISAPMEPWARAITATSTLEFVTWGGLCLAIWVTLFELTARIPIDFRELSLETSAKVAERIRRHRRVGGGASASRISKFSRGWQVPWLFGRGPSGAIAWRKCVAIVRKARGTLMVSIFVLFLVTMFVSATMRGSQPREVLGGAAMITLLGTFYLGAGLRFDFREDLDRMELVKIWPHSPRRIFVATLLPQVLLISALEIGCISLRALATANFHPGLLGILATVPLFVFAWVALDNAVFLFAPVRIVAGQEGALFNAGRALVMVLVRGVVFLVLSLAVFAGAATGFAITKHLLKAPEPTAYLTASICGWFTLLFANWAFALLGGHLIRRFDVARDRGR